MQGNADLRIATIDATPVLELRYDALGRRVEALDYTQPDDPCADPDGVVRTQHVYSGLEVIEEHVLCGLPENAEWALAREFLWGADHTEPLALIDWTEEGVEPAGTPEVLHYVQDALGSVVALTDAGDPNAQPDPIPPAVVERYEYDAYGRTYIEDAAGVRHAASQFGNPFMWTGQRYDAGVKLYAFPARTYSPELGRWFQRDPLGFVDGVNMYEYVASSPVNWIDPLGLELVVGGGGPNERKAVEKDLKKLCPQAQVDPKTGKVSIKGSSDPKPGSGGEGGKSGKDDQGGEPTSEPSAGQCSDKGADDKSGDGNTGGGAPPPEGPGCARLRNLINSKTRYVINHVSAGALNPQKQGGYFTPPRRGQHAQVEYENKEYDIRTKGGGTRKAKVWENLWHELTHADRHARGVYNDTDKGKEQVATIEETNSDLAKYNASVPENERLVPREPTPAN